MKKKMVYGLLVTMALIAMTGCQKTPDEQSVIQKDSEKMVEKATQKKKDIYKAPKTYKDSFANEKKTIKVTMNAAVNMPELDKVPVVEVGKREFTQKEADRFINYFSQGKTMYKLSDVWTKKDIQDRIIMLKGYMNDGGDDTDEMGKKYSVAIRELKEKLKTAPDTEKKEEASTKFIKSGNFGGSKISGYWMEDNGRKSVIEVNNGCNGNDVQLAFTRFPFKDQPNFMPLDAIGNGPLSQEDLDEMPFTKLSITEDDAQKTVEQALKDLNLKDFKVYEVTKAADQSVLLSYEPKQKRKIAQGYEVLCSRVVNSVQTNLSDQCIVVSRLDDKDVSNIEKDKNKNSEKEYTAPWDFESIAFIVDDSGIAGFKWLAPYQINSEITKDSNMMPFDQVMKIFKKAVFLQEETDGGKEDITVKNITLGLERVKKKNQTTQAYLVPVWTFQADEKINIEGSTQKYDNVNLLKLNAIDGSVVNPADDFSE